MKRWARGTAWVLMISLLALTPLMAAWAPAQRQALIRARYEKWAGVIRIWKCEESQGGYSLNRWVDQWVSAFEKRHPGVYVQVTEVTPEKLKDFNRGTDRPPDALLFPAGALDSPEGLAPIAGQYALRSFLSDVGWVDGKRYAVPVALGAYALALNESLLPDVPGDWGALPPLEKEKGEARFYLDAPADGPFESWSAALISLLAGQGVAPEERTPVGDGLDLGLAAIAPGETAALPARMPEDFRERASVYSGFVSGRLAAIPVSESEAQRLVLLSEQGKGVRWRAEGAGRPFTDRITLAAVVQSDLEDGEARRALCGELIDLMLSGDVQEKLASCGRFPAVQGVTLYAGRAGFDAMERTLAKEDVLTAPAFGKTWRERAARLMDEAARGADMEEAWEALKRAIGERAP